MGGVAIKESYRQLWSVVCVYCHGAYAYLQDMGGVCFMKPNLQ